MPLAPDLSAFIGRHLKYNAADARTKIRQQEFAIDRLPVRDREAKGPVMTSKRIEFIGAAKPADWDDTLTGPRGRLSNINFRGQAP